LNEVPPNRDLGDDVDDAYRRASHKDRSRPSESARRAVLEHAAQLAAERNARKERTVNNGSPDIDFKEPAANQSHWRPAIFGTLAAAAIAGLLITPHYLSSPGPGVASLPPARTAVPSTASAPLPDERSADQSDFPRDATSTERRSGAPSAQEQSRGKSPLAARNAAPAAPAAPAADLAGDAAKRDRHGAEGAKGPAASALPVPRRQSDELAEASTQAQAPQSVAQAARSARAASDRAPAPPASPTDPALQLQRAAENGEIVELQALLDRQIAIEARDADGRTPLMLATLHGHTEAVRVLLAHGADPNAADARGVTPLQAALAGHQSDIAVELRLAGAR
jgi:Ankyrin repeats (3 copies)